MKKAEKRIRGLLMAVLMVFQLPFSVLAEDVEIGAGDSYVYSFEDDSAYNAEQTEEENTADIADNDPDIEESGANPEETISDGEQTGINGECCGSATAHTHRSLPGWKKTNRQRSSLRNTSMSMTAVSRGTGR